MAEIEGVNNNNSAGQATTAAPAKKPRRLRMPPMHVRSPPGAPPRTRAQRFGQGSFISLKTWQIVIELALCRLRNPKAACPIPSPRLTGVQDAWDLDRYEET